MGDLPPYPEYKDSGSAWLGRIPAHWEIERAKWLYQKMARAVDESHDVVTCFRDGTVTLRKNRRTLGFTNSLKEIGYQGVCKGDLVIHAMDAFAGAVGVSDSDGKCTPVYAICTAKTDLDNRYYAYVIREMARSQWILALARGIRERSTDFRFETFGAQLLPVPSREEQKVIADYLDDNALKVRRFIHNRRRLIEVLSEHKQAIINRAVTRGLDPNVPLKPSGIDWIGDIPEHWQVLPLKRLLRRLIDCEHKTAPAIDESNYRVVRTTAVRNGYLHLSGTYCTPQEAFDEWTRRGLPEAGDVIFTREAPAGEACLIPDSLQLCLGQRTVLMKLKRECYDPKFLVFMIYGGPPVYRIRLASQGSTVGHFNMDDIAAMQVLVPPLSEQQSIVASIEAETSTLEAAIAKAEREIDLIREYRTRLISDVVTGKIDVRHLALQLDAADADNLDSVMANGEFEEDSLVDAAEEAASEEEVAYADD